MGDQGLFAIPISDEYGGMGGTFTMAAIAVEEIAYHDPSVATAVYTLLNNGWPFMLYLYGSEEAKQEIIPKVAAGEAFYGIASTEPQGGSDVAAIAFIAVSSPIPSPAGPPIPPSLASLALVAPFAAAYYSYKLLAACGVRCLLRGSARVSAEDLAMSGFYRWWIPRSREGGGCGIEVSPPEEAARSGGSVDATPGLPLVSLVALGYATYLLSSILLAG
jgi:alkylation response protein AidB-like acyl-CoA dehydrogenase